MDVSDNQVLLLFRKGASTEDTVTPFGTIPATAGDGFLHVTFGIPATDFQRWQDRLQGCGVEIESEVTWPEGGDSLYFRDPDNHVVELKTSNWHGVHLS